MMVLSGLLKSSSQHSKEKERDDILHEKEKVSPSRYIRASENLLPIEQAPDLQHLNNSLNALSAIFPDVQIEVFREMLSTFTEESRLAVVTEALLKNKMKWVHGRYKSNKAVEPVLAEDKFRSEEYRKAVKAVTYHEFKGLPRSTINAVLAEFNHSYSLARPTLIALSSKSWRYSISSVFLRRKAPSSKEAEHHPLVIWQSTGHGSIVPTIKTTGSAELDKELFETLVLPIQTRVTAEREEKDHALAVELNNKEAEDNEDLLDCECCYTSTTFEEISVCNAGGHFVCFQCVRHATNEALFGQGWQRNIDIEGGSLRCVAAVADSCRGCIPQQLVRRAFGEEKAGADIMRKLDERLAEDNLQKTQLPLIRCPFCNYAEIDELYVPESHKSWRLKRRIGPASLYTIVILILGVGMIPFLLPVFLLFSLFFLLVSSRQTFGDFALGHLSASVARLRRKRLGLKFSCQNEACKRPSCISCSKAWTDIHICHESSLIALRTQVELAMSLAIKRTCPRCNTSFVKSSGCNKLTCVCGYQMCYVCRKDIGNGEGYRHFCEHFRPNGGKGCTDCSKCDLYRCEDDEVVVRKAKEEAERRWMEKEGNDLGDDKARKVLKIGSEPLWPSHWQWEWPKWESLLDAIVEGVIQ